MKGGGRGWCRGRRGCRGWQCWQGGGGRHRNRRIRIGGIVWNVWRRHICVEKSLWRIHNNKTRECQHEKIWRRTALSWVRGNGKYRGILIEGTVSNCKKKGLLSCSETSGSLTLLRSGCSTPTGNVKRRSLLECYVYISKCCYTFDKFQYEIDCCCLCSIIFTSNHKKKVLQNYLKYLHKSYFFGFDPILK